MNLKEEISVAQILKQQKERKDQENHTIEKLEKHYSSGSQNGLSGYTHYPDVNKYLWDKHHGGKENSEMESNVATLDTTLKSKKTPEKLTVWSKSRHDPRVLKDEHGIVHHPAYLSASIKKEIPLSLYNDRNVVKDENGVNHHHIYQIDIPKGHPGAYIPDKSNCSKEAKEFVLPRGTNLKYNGTETHPDISNVYHYHKLSVIQPN